MGKIRWRLKIHRFRPALLVNKITWEFPRKHRGSFVSQSYVSAKCDWNLKRDPQREAALYKLTSDLLIPAYPWQCSDLILNTSAFGAKVRARRGVEVICVQWVEEKAPNRCNLSQRTFFLDRTCASNNKTTPTNLHLQVTNDWFDGTVIIRDRANCTCLRKYWTSALWGLSNATCRYSWNLIFCYCMEVLGVFPSSFPTHLSSSGSMSLIAKTLQVFFARKRDWFSFSVWVALQSW